MGEREEPIISQPYVFIGRASVAARVLIYADSPEHAYELAGTWAEELGAHLEEQITSPEGLERYGQLDIILDTADDSEMEELEPTVITMIDPAHQCQECSDHGDK